MNKSFRNGTLGVWEEYQENRGKYLLESYKQQTVHSAFGAGQPNVLTEATLAANNKRRDSHESC